MCGALDKKDLVVDSVEPPRWGERALFRLTLTTKKSNEKTQECKNKSWIFAVAHVAHFLLPAFSCVFFFSFWFASFLLALILFVIQISIYIYMF